LAALQKRAITSMFLVAEKKGGGPKPAAFLLA
jgi:hypothetical protein